MGNRTLESIIIRNPHTSNIFSRHREPTHLAQLVRIYPSVSNDAYTRSTRTSGHDTNMTKKRILLVDDEPSFTRVLKLYIERSGSYEVTEENRGEMAIETARRFKPDLILLDVMMPEVDGGEVAAEIRSDTKLKNTPIVFVTAALAKNEQGVISGFPFISKPVTGEQVMKCIQEHLGPIPKLPHAPVMVAGPGPSIHPTLPPPQGKKSNELPYRNPIPITTAYGIPLLLAVFLTGAGLFVYRIYSQTKETQQETFMALQKTQEELSLLRSSAKEAILRQQTRIEYQSKQLAEKNDSLRRLKAMEDLLEKTLVRIGETKGSQSKSVGVYGSLLSDFAPSVVKVYCLSNSYSDHVQKGSGLLFRAANNNPKLPLYYVQTSLHVVTTTDGSLSQCRIVLYPDHSDSNSYLLFKSKGHRSYAEDIDLAIIEPELVTANTHAGSRHDLIAHARHEVESTQCESVSIGEHVAILGYPGIGGETLSVSEGIISGFEVDGRSRYIKTSAKTDRGNSGGVAIQSSGCIVGIPTFSRRGRVESMGRILDLSHLRSEILKFLTLK